MIRDQVRVKWGTPVWASMIPNPAALFPFQVSSGIALPGFMAVALCDSLEGPTHDL